nr:YolD-like family protein [Brevibacillus laterosporus]
MSSKIKNLFGSSRLVLPEQREAYLQYRVDEKLVPMPILESDELASMPIVMN